MKSADLNLQNKLNYSPPGMIHNLIKQYIRVKDVKDLLQEYIDDEICSYSLSYNDHDENSTKRNSFIDCLMNRKIGIWVAFKDKDDVLHVGYSVMHPIDIEDNVSFDNYKSFLIATSRATKYTTKTYKKYNAYPPTIRHTAIQFYNRCVRYYQNLHDIPEWITNLAMSHSLKMGAPVALHPTKLDTMYIRKDLNLKPIADNVNIHITDSAST